MEDASTRVIPFWGRKPLTWGPRRKPMLVDIPLPALHTANEDVVADILSESTASPPFCLLGEGLDHGGSWVAVDLQYGGREDEEEVLKKLEQWRVEGEGNLEFLGSGAVRERGVSVDGSEEGEGGGESGSGGVEKGEEAFGFTDSRRLLMSGYGRVGEGSVEWAGLSLFGYSYAMLRWHAHMQYCSRCGGKMAPKSSGMIRTCESCSKSVHPRVDPVVIMLLTSPDGSHALIGRSASHPTGMYSCLAGFMEPGESLEEGAARELFEETKLRVKDVRIVNSQPWAVSRGDFAQVMIGCVATLDHPDPAALPAPDLSPLPGNEPELEDAKWISRDEVIELVKLAKIGPTKHSLEHPPDTFLPGPVAIAHHLLAAWAGGEKL